MDRCSKEYMVLQLVFYTVTNSWYGCSLLAGDGFCCSKFTFAALRQPSSSHVTCRLVLNCAE